MDKSKLRIRFPIVNITGEVLKQPGLWGSLGFSEMYNGTLQDDDQCILSLKKLWSKQELTEQEAMLVRSFTIAWLTSFKPQLSAVVNQTVALPPSVLHIGRIGLLDRTAKQVTAATASVLGTAMFLNSAWQMATVDFAALSGAESALFVFEQVCSISEARSQLSKYLTALDNEVGSPGQPTARSAFDASSLYDFLKLCRFREVLARQEFDRLVYDRLRTRLDNRIFSLFLANSRQIEGLILSGSSESSAAVSAHAALALGLNDLAENQSLEIFRSIETNITELQDDTRRQEAENTFRTLAENQTGQAAVLERQLRRHLDSSMATEAVDLATMPIATTFEFLGHIADGMGKYSPNSKAGSFLSLTGDGFRVASRTVDATPDALSKIIQGGVLAESWIRKLPGKLWPLGRKTQAKPASTTSPQPDDSQS